VGKKNREADGSAMLVAVFVLVLLSALGIALLFLGRTETMMSQADVRAKRVFYYSEAGLEDGRATVHATNRTSVDPLGLSDELVTAAGPDGTLDFDAASLVPAFDSDGNLTGLSGYNDDVPVRVPSVFADGWYAAFATNDSGGSDSISSTSDTNDLIMLTGVGAGPDRSLEIVQAVVQRFDLFPTLPATITILGEPGCDPATDCALFDGGSSVPKRYSGQDGGTHCPGGDPTVTVPVVGVIGGSSETTAETGVVKPASYSPGGSSTVEDLLLVPGLDAMWTDCGLIREFAQLVKDSADVVGSPATPLASLGTAATPKIVFIEGDYSIPGGFSGGGLLFVTGALEVHGGADWYGPIFTIGIGDFSRQGAGNGDIVGGVVVADISGLDRVLFTGDDCAGDDGISGTSDDGMSQATYTVPGGGNSVTGYCSSYMVNLQAARPLEVVSFRQF